MSDKSELRKLRAALRFCRQVDAMVTFDGLSIVRISVTGARATADDCVHASVLSRNSRIRKKDPR